MIRRENTFRINLYILFFLSGACGLVYEVLWGRMLVLVFGTSVMAVSTVLASFMGGLALGSFCFGRWADRIGNPLKVYAGLEVGIGLYAVALPLLFSGLDRVYTWVYAAFHTSFYPLSLLRFALSFLVLLVPAALMGGTLPVIGRALAREARGLGRDMGRLYAINTFGAVLGCLAAGFLLIAVFGVSGTLYVTAAANVLIGVAAFVWSRRLPGGTEALPEEEAPMPEAEDRPRYPVRVAYLALAAYGLSGCAALGYEVAWTRLLTFVSRSNTTYAFAVMLAAFLCGLAIGSALFSAWADRRRDLVFLLGGMEIAIGLWGILSIALFDRLDAVTGPMAGLPFWWMYVGGRFAISFVIMLIPTILMGGAFPIAVRLYASLNTLGRDVGRLYALNTLGAILGSFATGFLLIPAIGTQNALLAMAAINLIAGGILFAFDPSRRPRFRGAALGVAGALAAILYFVVPSDPLPRIYARSEPDCELIYYDEDIAGTVTIHRRGEDYLLLKISGTSEVPTYYGALQNFRLLGHLPALLHPGPRNALSIAFGAGIALGTLGRYDLEQIDCVEIVSGVPNAARHFSHLNYDILDDPRVRVIIDDGRNFLAKARRRYDVITVDSTHPRSTDSWVLYTREFYETCWDHLAAEGVMVQWLPIHGLSEPEYRMIVRTFRTVFPHTSIWLTTEYTILVGTMGATEIDFDRVRAELARPEIDETLRSVNLSGPYALINCLVMAEEAIEHYVGPGPINTDDRPRISFLGPSDPGRDKHLAILSGLNRRRENPYAYLSNIRPGDRDRVRGEMDRYFRSRGHTVQGDILRFGGKLTAAEAEYRIAREINPEDRNAAHFYNEMLRHQDEMIQQHERRVASSGSAAAYAELGGAYHAKRMYDRALSAYQKALERNPNMAGVWNNIGNIHRSRGDHRKAWEAYERALRADPNFFYARVNLANILRAQGEYARALDELKAALEINPDFLLGLYYIGKLYEEVGEPEQARRGYREFLARAKERPDDPGARYEARALERLRHLESDAIGQ